MPRFTDAARVYDSIAEEATEARSKDDLKKKGAFKFWERFFSWLERKPMDWFLDRQGIDLDSILWEFESG